MSSYSSVHAHDRFVRTLMSDLRIAREFFTKHLPPELLASIDLNRLTLQPRSFIDDIRKESIVDLLYLTFINGEEAYLYLLVEHQSTPDELLPFRMLRYKCRVC